MVRDIQAEGEEGHTWPCTPGNELEAYVQRAQRKAATEDGLVTLGWVGGEPESGKQGFK